MRQKSKCSAREVVGVGRVTQQNWNGGYLIRVGAGSTAGRHRGGGGYRSAGVETSADIEEDLEM